MPTWISHRGYKQAAEENTRRAFVAARQAGFTWVETDLRLSKDGHIVLHHDPTLERLFQRAINVRDLTRQELEELRLPSGDRLMFLDQLLADFADLHWIFDIKAEHGLETITALMALADATGKRAFLEDKVRFLMWDAEHERALREHLPEAHFYARKTECYVVGFALILNMPLRWFVRPGRTYSLPTAWKGMRLLRRAYIDRIKRTGVRILAFLPRGDAETSRAVSIGCDEILTDDAILKS